MQFSWLCCGLGNFLRRLVWIAMPAGVSLSTRVKICQTIHKYEKLRLYCQEIGQIWQIYFSPQICRFLVAGIFLTSLRLFVKKIFLGSRRAHCDCTKYAKFIKSAKIHKIYEKYRLYCQENRQFWQIWFSPQICRFLGAGTSLTSLRLFVKKIFLGSRRAHCDCTKHAKIINQSKCTQIWEI